jgi:hypothetical protein
MRSAGSDTAIRKPEQSSPRPRLLHEVRSRLRLKHYSLRTEQAYLYWIRRYIRYNGLRHPREFGGTELERFLSDLATRARVAPSTQNQTLVALAIRQSWRDRWTKPRRPLETLQPMKDQPSLRSRMYTRSVHGSPRNTTWRLSMNLKPMR